MNVRFDPLELIDVQQLADDCSNAGVMQGEYHWHQHDDEDEFFTCQGDGAWRTFRTAPPRR